MAVTKYFSKISLPTPKDFPHIPKKDFHAIHMASQVLKGGFTLTDISSRLWLIMGNFGINKNGVEGPLFPTNVFFSDNRGESWEQLVDLPKEVEYFSEVQVGKDGSVIFIERFPNTDKRHIAIWRLFLEEKQGVRQSRWKRLAPLYDPRAVAWYDPHHSYITIKDSASKNGGDMLCLWIGLDSIMDYTNDPSHTIKFKSIDYSHRGMVASCSFGDDSYRFTVMHSSQGLKAIYAPAKSDIDFKQVLLNKKLGRRDVDYLGITSEGELLQYEGESLFLPVIREEVYADPESKMATTREIPDKLVMAWDTDDAHLCMITTKSTQKVVKKHTYTKYANTAWVGVPKPVEVKP